MEYIATGIRNNIANWKSVPLYNMATDINTIKKTHKINFRNMILFIRLNCQTNSEATSSVKNGSKLNKTICEQTHEKFHKSIITKYTAKLVMIIVYVIIIPIISLRSSQVVSF
jgi:hypothetical protein